MNMLVEEKIYKKIIIYDYQGVCFKPDKEDDANSSSFLYTVSIPYLIFFFRFSMKPLKKNFTAKTISFQLFLSSEPA
jgi:hypothetical protein